ncbi:hypothetical protein [Priestia megaterium]
MKNKGKKRAMSNSPMAIVTADQVILNLKNSGVVFEENTKPFAKNDNNYASIMGNYEKRVVIK